MLLKMGTITANFIKPRALINLLLQISSERGTRDYPCRGRQQAAACASRARRGLPRPSAPGPGPGPAGPRRSPARGPPPPSTALPSAGRRGGAEAACPPAAPQPPGPGAKAGAGAPLVRAAGETRRPPGERWARGNARGPAGGVRPLPLLGGPLQSSEARAVLS